MLLLAWVAADQVSKLLIQSTMPLYTAREIIPGFFRLWHIRNSGAVWGFFSGARGLIPKIITAVSMLALVLVAYFFLKVRADRRWELWAFALILGGALGNICDRLRLGYVIDFLDLHIRNAHWPTFNLADSGITVGVLILVFFLGKENACIPS